MEGGYQIIDLKNKPIAEIPRRFDGVYGLVEGTRKPLLIQNIVQDNLDSTKTEYRDFIGSPKVSGTAFLISDYSQGITIRVERNMAGQSVVSIETPNVSASTDGEEITALLEINNTLEIDESGALGVASN